MPKSLRLTCLLVLCLAVLTLTPVGLSGQTAVGIQPFGTFQSGQADTINVGDLGVHISIPLFTHKARGRNAGLSVVLRYDSFAMYNDVSTGYISGPWHLDVTTASGGFVKTTWLYGGDCSGMGDDGNYHDGGTFDVYNYSFTDETGFGHGFAGESRVTSNCGSGWSDTTLNEYAEDGSGYHLTASGATATVVDPAGTKYEGFMYYPHPTITDSNGNVGYYFGSGFTGSFTDNSNVSVGLTGGNSNYNPYPQVASRNPGYVTYTDASGVQRTITVNFQMYSINGQNIDQVDSIVYPDGSSYHFTYQQRPCGNGYIRSIESMQLPTGGTISYHYSSSDGCATYNSLTRTTSDGTTTYSKTVESQVAPFRSRTDVSYADGSSQTIKFASTSNPAWADAKYYETSHSWKTASGSVIKSSMKCYNGATGDCTYNSITVPFSQMSTVTTLDSGQTSKKVEFFNASSLPTQVDEYDYGASTLARRTVTVYANLGNYISDRPESVTVRDGNGTQVARTTFGYDENSLASSGIGTSGGRVAVSGARGNQTSKHVWVNTTGGTLDTHWNYDDAGRTVGIQDQRGNWTQYGYNTQSCQTSVTPPPPSNGISKGTSATCDPYVVFPQTATDANGTVTHYYYNAMLNPSEKVTNDSNGTRVADEVYSYSSPVPTMMTSTIYKSASSSLQSTVVLDSLGRTISKVSPNGATVATTYDSMGRVKSVTNPYFSTSDATYGITSYLYDALGRTTYQCQPDDGGTNTSTCNHTSSYKSWTYYGNSTTFRDEAGKQWKRTDDALGRLTSIAEDPSSWNYITNYTHDTLNNLTRVDQWGASSNNSNNRVRTFTYDSLSRLLSANNPESGTTSYTYFASGSTLCAGDPKLPCSKTNGNNITSAYSYDELNRIIQKSSPSRNYSYAYDSASISNCGNLSGTYPIGRLTYVSNNVNAAEFFVYNAIGLLTRETHWTPSNASVQANPVCAMRDWAGNVTQLTYPDGRVVTQQFDGTGNLSSVTYDNWNGLYMGYNYMSAATYWPDGAPAAMTAGNSLTTTWYRNKRQQPKETVLVNGGGTQLMDRQYCYGASVVSGANCTTQSVGDNGNIFQIKDILNGNNSQSFSYDNLNRLISFNNGSNSMQQNYAIDPWGNSIQSGTLNSGTSFAGATTNRDTSGLTGYDNAGNTTSYWDGVRWHYYAYDDDGEITGIDNGTSTYAYSAAGNRVRKDSGSSWTEYIDFGGLTVTEKNSDGSWSDYIFANGTRIAQASSANALTPPSSTTYYHGDQIGSTRMVTNGGGGIISTYEFYPYGEGPQPTTQNHYLFSGKERDMESGLDYFGARYYTAIVGRFMSADWSAQVEPVPYAKLEEPQSLNLYAYVRNNPISLVDPDGHYPNDGWAMKTIYRPDPEGYGGMMGSEMMKAIGSMAEAQQQSARKTSFWRGLSNLLHVHSWNYVKTSVTTTETYNIAGVLAPAANAAAQAAKAHANPPGPPTPAPIPRPVPGPDPVPPQLGPGEIPEIEPGASMAQRWGVAFLNIVKGFGQNVEAMPVVCFTCNVLKFSNQMYPDGDPNQTY